MGESTCVNTNRYRYKRNIYTFTWSIYLRVLERVFNNLLLKIINGRFNFKHMQMAVRWNKTSLWSEPGRVPLHCYRAYTFLLFSDVRNVTFQSKVLDLHGRSLYFCLFIHWNSWKTTNILKWGFVKCMLFKSLSLVDSIMSAGGLTSTFVCLYWWVVPRNNTAQVM